MRSFCKQHRIVFAAPALVAAVSFFALAHARPASRFAAVAVGMSQAQVAEIMGEPLGVRRDGIEHTAFYYGGFQRGRWCTMEIFFSADGTVAGKFHDH